MDLESNKAKRLGAGINRTMDGAQRGGIGIIVRGAYLDQPTMMRATISTHHLLKQYGDIPGIRPFSFITVLPGLSAYEILTRKRENCGLDDDERPCYDELNDIAFYAPFTNRSDDIKDNIRRNDTGELVKSLKHKTLLERLAGYFRRKESKSYPSDGYGLLARKHVNVVEHVYIGKESRDIKESLLEETGDVIGHHTDSDTPEYARTGVAGFVAAVGLRRSREELEYRGER
jgi:hypothetical protein